MDDLESEVSKPVTSFECDKECQGCKVKRAMRLLLR
jgi:hypothetical protein